MELGDVRSWPGTQEVNGTKKPPQDRSPERVEVQPFTLTRHCFSKAGAVSKADG
jgi:hypothetical protein